MTLSFSDFPKSALVHQSPVDALKKRIDEQSDKIAGLEALVNTVLLTCDPPDDFKDVEILKDHMRACFDKATELKGGTV